MELIFTKRQVCRKSVLLGPEEARARLVSLYTAFPVTVCAHMCSDV